MNKKPLVINFLGAPGTGKTTLASLVFAKLKTKGCSCEIAMEFAKEIVWEKRIKTLQNQLYVFSEQFYRLWRVRDEVDVVITDSPIILSIYYNMTHEKKDRIPEQSFNSLILDCYKLFSNVNYFVRKGKNRIYEVKGRRETESQSAEVELKMQELYKSLKVPYRVVTSSDKCADKIVEQILKRIEKRKH